MQKYKRGQNWKEKAHLSKACSCHYIRAMGSQIIESAGLGDYIINCGCVLSTLNVTVFSFPFLKTLNKTTEKHLRQQ